MTGGFNRSDLLILAGRPGMGKTSLATNEIAAQDQKWGFQATYRHRFMSILTEEVGEVAEALLAIDEAKTADDFLLTSQAAVDELVQVTAVAIQFAAHLRAHMEQLKNELGQ